MVIVNGWGSMVPVILAGAALAGWQLGAAIGGRTTAADLILLFLTIAGIGMIFLGQYLRRSTGKVLIDPGTRRKMIYGGHHYFLFIPMQIWGWIFAVWCGAALVLGIYYPAFRLVK